jgi:two-component system, sporulation sensor kinase E
MNPIRNRLIIFSVIFILAICAIGFTGLKILDSFQNRLITDFSLPLVKAIKENLEHLSAFRSHQLSPQTKREIHQLLLSLTEPENVILSIQIIDTSQQVIVSNILTERGQVIAIPDLEKHNDLTSPLIQKGQTVDGQEIIEIVFAHLAHNKKTGYLRVALSNKGLVGYFDNVRFLYVILIGVLGLLIFFTLLLFNKMYRKPLEHLDYAISKMDEDDFTYRVKYKKSDEFTDTFTKLNRTIEKVSYLKEDYNKAEKRIISLLKAVNDSILVLDTKKNVTSFNDATYKLFKSDKKRFPEWFISILGTNRELNHFISTVLKEEGQVKEKEITIFLPDESELLVKMSIQALKEENVIQGTVLTFKDLKLINELENNLLRSMKFGVITNLASSMSHEIKNPLSSMALHAEILESRLKKMDFEQKSQVLRSVQTLQSESGRLNRIIQQFLTLARPSKLELNLINLNQIIEEVLELVQQQAQEMGISIYSDLDPSLGVIYGDEDQLKQVILNIILNAFAATEMGGKVNIVSRAEYERILVQIRDTGRGIPEKIRDKIFDLYFTTKRDGGGVGLSVCQNIIRAHDGHLEFESIEGEGTVFTIQLPIKDPTTIRSTRIKPVRKDT